MELGKETSCLLILPCTLWRGKSFFSFFFFLKKYINEIIILFKIQTTLCQMTTNPRWLEPVGPSCDIPRTNRILAVTTIFDFFCHFRISTLLIYIDKNIRFCRSKFRLLSLINHFFLPFFFKILPENTIHIDLLFWKKKLSKGSNSLSFLFSSNGVRGN